MKKYDNQICLKIADPLRETLEAEASADGRNLSSLIRKILTEYATRRVVSRETNKAA